MNNDNRFIDQIINAEYTARQNLAAALRRREELTEECRRVCEENREECDFRATFEELNAKLATNKRGISILQGKHSKAQGKLEWVNYIQEELASPDAASRAYAAVHAAHFPNVFPAYANTSVYDIADAVGLGHLATANCPDAHN